MARGNHRADIVFAFFSQHLMKLAKKLVGRCLLGFCWAPLLN